MKKTISILLVICMALSVCACSGGDSDDPQKGSDRESYSPDYGKLYYEANGVKFGIMDYADEVMEKPVSYTHHRDHETSLQLVCRILREKK